MMALVLLLAGLASILPFLVRKLGGERRPGWQGAGVVVGTVAIVAVGVLLGLGPLRLSGAAVAAACAVPILWTAWSALAPGGGWADAGPLIVLTAGCGVCLVLADPVGTRPATACAAVGAAILLGAPANAVVSAVLTLARGAGSDQGATATALVPMLRGGRWIGPLERILILLLAAAGAHAAVAAVIAAKGVIRFPEISKDEDGRKAEEFLIGSLTSWILAVLAVGAVAAA
ncbi:beta-carotene 15,15'-monooxygenase [Actinomyces sp. MRS3W]|uniref:beta-carotene 15,15'-monooxygenase n=1 Tax=Actinomyces sp. MRS3W TaxID=2800796 RepID=UPI0028FD2071|nr:beta-carotene 15,15'-monooxygenase [Actinomyces sp. MRS3W]MDU0348818.1 beta-carotene 15,15'-monooxygenase [Actinomyces sp. MRS3W]